MPPISFNEVPANILVPFVYVEFDNSQAIQGPQIQPYKGLLIGQKTDAGTQDALAPVRITSAQQAANLFGAGSMLHGMAQAWFASNRFTELWAVAFADDEAFDPAAGEIDFAGPASGSGTISLYIAGRRVQVAVASGDTAAEIATAAAAAINAETSIPVTAEVDGGDDTVVLVEAKNAGAVGNQIDIRLGYNAEELPAGVTAAITAMSGGDGAPDFDDLWSALGDDHFNIWANPYTDTASMTAIKAELITRAGPTIQHDAVAFSALGGSVGTVGTYGDSHNNQFISVAALQNSPTPAYEKAAEIAAIVAINGQRDPARPFQTLQMLWTKAPAKSDRFTLEERNLLLADGIATTKVTPDGFVMLERIVSTYKQNAQGADDASYRDVNTILTLSYLRYDLRNYLLRKYPRSKLANDGTKFGAGQAIVTPKLVKAECVTKFREWENIGLVEGIDQFKKDLVVERNVSDPNRLDILLPPDLVNQLRVIGTQISFRLQTSSVGE